MSCHLKCLSSGDPSAVKTRNGARGLSLTEIPSERKNDAYVRIKVKAGPAYFLIYFSEGNWQAIPVKSWFGFLSPRILSLT